MSKRTFGTQLNHDRRPFATLNIQNINVNLKQSKPSLVDHLPSTRSFENQENLNHIAYKPSKNVAAKNDAFEIYIDNKECAQSAQRSFSKSNEEILDENIEAVKKELNSFLIDSHEKSLSDVPIKEEKSLDTSIPGDNEENQKDSSQDGSLMEQSEISYVQHCSDFEMFTEYSGNVLLYMLERERRFMPDPFYMNRQTNINSKMRSILVDWLIDVADEYKLKDETLFLAISYIDRYLSKVSITRQEFQLLGTSALFIASKYEEIYPPEIGEFVYITDDSFTKSQILKMEKMILTVLSFDISTPTANYFLEMYLSELALEPEIYCLSKYLCFLSMLECTPFLKYYPSEIALCSLLLACKILYATNKIPQNFVHNSLAYERSLSSEGDVIQFLNERSNLYQALDQLRLYANKHQQQAIQRKYSTSKYYGVASLSNVELSN